MMILYGSQTGNAQQIACNLGQKLSQSGVTVPVQSMGEWMRNNTIEDLLGIGTVVVVISTTGNGDAPDNAAKFWRKFRIKSKKDSEWLQGLQFSILGLGDTNYDQFCFMGKQFDAFFRKSGAAPFHESAFADEAIGLADTVEPWIASIVSCLSQKVAPVTKPLELEVRNVEGVPRWREPKLTVEWTQQGAVDQYRVVRSPRWVGDSNETELPLRGYTPDTPFLSHITAAQMLTSTEAPKQVLHLELQVPYENKGLTYSPGDAIGMYFPNPPRLVSQLLSCLGLEGTRVFDITSNRPAHIQAPCTVEDVFTYCTDLSSPPKKALLRVLAEYCSDEGDRAQLYHLCGRSKESRAAYISAVLAPKTSIVSILHQFPSCQPDMAHLLDLLPPLQPRYYSVASSPNKHPTELHFAITVVRYDIQGTQHAGLCSSWLYHLARRSGFLDTVPALDDSSPYPCSSDDRDLNSPVVPVFIRSTKEFTLPSSSDTPMILVGPGTGLAPFRGFLQHRQSRLKALKTGGTCVGWWRGFECDLAETEQKEDNRFEASHDVAIPSTGEAYLFFGCRKPEWDYLYKDELTTFERDGTLDRLFVAFSRQERQKVYVQDLIRSNAHDVYRLVDIDDAVVFVCGDGREMARDVFQTFTAIMREEGCMSEAEANAYMGELVKKGRYVQDIWM